MTTEVGAYPKIKQKGEYDYGREHFEKEVIPEIRAYKRTRGVELRARLIKERKEREKANPPKPTEESNDDDEEVF